MEVEKNKENFEKFVYDPLRSIPTQSNPQNSEVLESSDQLSLDQGYQCLSCPKVFEQKQSLSKHVKIHKAEEGHVCPQCSKKFVAYRDLRKHVDIVHLHKAEEYKKQCPICNIRVQQLKTHIRFIHRNEGKISEYSGKCPHCQKTFADDYKVKRHIETVHEGVKPWHCKLCPKRFYERKDLGRHVRGVHMGEKVDTWKHKKNLNNINDGLNVDQREEEIELNLVDNNLIAPTVDDVGSSINLPINVLAEEVDDKNEKNKDGECEEFIDDSLVIDDEEILDVDEEGSGNADSDVRFQVCDKRIDDNGDIVLQIAEKNPVKTNSKMVTLRWGNNVDIEDRNNEMNNESKILKKCKTEDKIMELNLKLEDIVHYSKEGDKQLDEDYLLPEVVGDFHNWLDEDFDKDKINEETKTAFKCGACGKMFVTLDFLKTHIEKTHFKTTIDSTTNKIVETEENKNTLCSTDIDKKKVAVVNKIDCEFDGCDAKFTGKGRRLQQKRHVERKHMKIRDKKCAKCDLSFYEKRDLSRHVEAVHLKVRTMCPVEGCGRPVVRLDQHIKLVHSDRSPAKSQCKCEECGATFGRIYDLARHKENVHRGFKNFACDKCDRRFSDKRDLKRHHDAVHLNIKQTKVYTCNICLTNFKFKKHLDSHRLTEHKDDTSATEVVFSQEPPNSPQILIQQLENNVRATDVVISVNNIPQCVTQGEEDLFNVEEFSTVDVDGQLFLVQQGPVGISLLPVLQTLTGTTLHTLSETSSVTGYS